MHVGICKSFYCVLMNVIALFSTKASILYKPQQTMLKVRSGNDDKSRSFNKLKTRKRGLLLLHMVTYFPKILILDVLHGTFTSVRC